MPFPKMAEAINLMMPPPPPPRKILVFMEIGGNARKFVSA